MAGADREKALDAALAQVEKQFGKGSVMRLGDETRAPLEVIPTGSIALDVALGLGGLRQVDPGGEAVGAGGVVVLMLTPVARVAVLTLGLLARRDWPFVALSVWILGVLLSSLRLARLW